MDSKRRLFKQIFIAVVYLATFSGLGTGIYFLARPIPTPPPPPAPTIYPIETIWSQVFTGSADTYSLAAEIRNLNTNFGASNFNYSFYLYDTNNVLVSIVKGQSFIWPGESKYIIEGGVNLLKAPIKLVFEIENPFWREVKNFKGIDLTLENINYEKGKQGSGKFFMVDFTANNNTPFNLGKVYISAVVLNKEKLPIAVGSTILENLKSKERRLFSIPWFSPFLGNSDSVNLSISTNLWETPALFGQ
ncbi:MAG: hypothetical protein Q8Q89_04395 [bacterium]|nr:hypothetical protein [bacterium]